MKWIFHVLCCLLTTNSFAQKTKKVSDRFAGLDTAIGRILKDWKAAGFAVAVVEKNKIVYAKGFGYKDWEAKLPVTANTQFAIGSCSKAFTAALVGLLAKDGKVNLDKPVTNYLPDLRFYNAEMNNNVTLRDMMSHRTGVSRFDYSWYLFPTSSRDSLMKRIQYMEPSEPLRSKWQYNNFMFLLQGMVTEKITGKTWEANVQEKLLAPLGMTNTNTGLADWMKAADIAKGYTLRKDSIMHRSDYYDISGMAPAGSINSSVNDMAKWLMLWINGGKYQGKEILPASYVADAMSSQMVVSPALPSPERADSHLSNYGFGWMLSSYRGHYRVEHGGNIDGFSASTSFFPSDSIGIVVLANQNASSVPGLVRNLIADRMLDLSYRDWHTTAYKQDTAGKARQKEALKAVVSDRKKGTSPTHLLKDYAGVYTSAAKESFEIVVNNDSLRMIVPSEKLYLRHYHYNVFNIWDKETIAANDSSSLEGLKIVFQIDEKGDISSASLPLEGTKPVVFNRAEKAMPITKDSLQKYVGEYSLGGAVIKVYIKGENTLYVFVPNQPEYELASTGPHKFKLIALTGYNVEFKSDDKGAISELVFLQPNGNFSAKKRID